jgi:hypothetical protein
VQSPSKKAPKIDLDHVRFYFLQDLAYSQALEKFAFVEGAGAVPKSELRETLDGVAYFTDGLRVVLWVSSEPVPISEVKFVEWERRPTVYRK